jgi:hypothetical protein
LRTAGQVSFNALFKQEINLGQNSQWLYERYLMRGMEIIKLKV